MPRKAIQQAPVMRFEPAKIAGRVPPHDLEAEAAVLSAMLLDHATIDQVRDVIQDPARFYSDANAAVAEAIFDLHKEGRPVDIITAASWLRDRDRLQKVGGTAYLAGLADATPAVSHVTAHASTVVEKWRLRQAIARCQYTAAMLYDEVPNVQERLDEHISLFGEIATSRVGEMVPSIGQGLIQQIEQDWQTVQQGGSLMGIRTGIDSLDYKIAGLHSGDVTVLAARPGQGKTALATTIAVNIVSPPEQTEELFRQPVEYGVPIFSMEMPGQQLRQRMVCTEAQCDLNLYRQGLINSEMWKRVFGAGQFLAGLPIWIDDTPAITVSQILARCRQIQQRWCRPAFRDETGKLHPERRLGAVIIDYLQLLGSEERGRSREEEVGNNSRAVKVMAKSLRVPVIALSQLNRGVETRGSKDKRPQLSDLRDSGAVEQDADNVIFIYRDEYYNPGKASSKGIAELIIAKQRSGPTGKVLTRFDAYCTRFSNLRPGEASAYTGDVGEDE